MDGIKLKKSRQEIVWIEEPECQTITATIASLLLLLYGSVLLGKKSLQRN